MYIFHNMFSLWIILECKSPTRTSQRMTLCPEFHRSYNWRPSLSRHHCMSSLPLKWSEQFWWVFTLSSPSSPFCHLFCRSWLWRTVVPLGSTSVAPEIFFTSCYILWSDVCNSILISQIRPRCNKDICFSPSLTQSLVQAMLYLKRKVTRIWESYYLVLVLEGEQ